MLLENVIAIEFMNLFIFFPNPPPQWNALKTNPATLATAEMQK